MDRFDYRTLAIAGATERSFGEMFRGSGLFAKSMRLSEAAHLTRPQAQSPIAFACIRANASALASVPRLVMDGNQPVENELSRLLGRPNPLMGGRKMHRAWSSSLDMAGGVFLFLLKGGQAIRPGQMPDAIWPVRDDLVEPVFEREMPFPVAWRTSIRDQQETFPDEAVAHIYVPDPAEPFRGFGPMQAAWRAADHLFRAEAFDDGLVENGGQIGGVFTHEQGKLNEKQLKVANATIAQNAAAPRNDRKKLILPAGMSYTPTTFTQVEMQAIEMRRFKREEVMRIFGTAPAILGELENANRSSLQEQRRVYYENVVAPLCDFLMEELHAQLIMKLPRAFHSLAIKLDYASTPAMREDSDAQLERVRKLVGMGVPFHLAAERVGYDIDRFEGDDVSYIDATLRVAGEDPFEFDPWSDEEEPQAPEKPKEEEPMAVATKAARDGGRARRAAAVDAE
ncbi:MAG: phage portal protein, partial [Rhodospirillaceae bacterium]